MKPNILSTFNSNSDKHRQKESERQKLAKEQKPQHKSAFRPVQSTKSSSKPMPKRTTSHYNSSIKPLNIYDSEYKSARITLLQLARLNAIQNIKGIPSRSKTIKMLLDNYIASNYNDSEQKIMRTFEKGFINQHK